ncbi:hypothetical protein PFISCL1PPCAC_7368, partial [Pristionchus fissidentatus]
TTTHSYSRPLARYLHEMFAALVLLSIALFFLYRIDLLLSASSKFQNSYIAMAVVWILFFRKQAAQILIVAFQFYLFGIFAMLVSVVLNIGVEVLFSAPAAIHPPSYQSSPFSSVHRQPFVSDRPTRRRME